MNLLESLLDAIVRLQGDALVMHVGEKPYVVTTTEAAQRYRGPLAWGQIELSSRALTPEAVAGMLAQILPVDRRSALDEYGAIEYDITSASIPEQHFTVVAARGGEDVWLEIRRRRSAPAVSSVPEAGAPADFAASTRTPIEQIQVAREEESSAADSSPAPPIEPEAAATVFGLEATASAAPPERPAEPEPVEPAHERDDETALALEFVREQMLAPDADWGDDVMTEGELTELLRASAVVEERAEPSTSDFGVAGGEFRAEAAAPAQEPSLTGWDDPSIFSFSEEARSRIEAGAGSHAGPDPGSVRAFVSIADEDAEPVERSRPALVVPLGRHQRHEPPPDAAAAPGTFDRMLRLAASRGATALYVVTQSLPLARVDGEFTLLEGEPVLGAAAVEQLIAEAAVQAADAPASGQAEWTIDVADVGRAHCMTFRDHRGPGLIVRIVPPRAVSADQLGLPPDVQAFCTEADGLVLVAGGRASGKSTLLRSFVDLINRSRSDHVIAIETRIDFLHENRRSLISQREARGDEEAAAAAVRAAWREDPDVLVIDDLQGSETAALALEAAHSGCLVFASIAATSGMAAVERLLEMFLPDRRDRMQALLAATLRGIVSQMLLRKLNGGKVAAREVLLNTDAVASSIQEGKVFQLAALLDDGQRAGMTSLTESLAALVREGVVHPAHACRRAPNREQFLAVLNRDGIDPLAAGRAG